MCNKGTFISFRRHGFHKGFYNDNDFNESLQNIRYSDYFEPPDDEEFLHTCAYYLLCGSCHIFALSLKKIFAYDAYIIEEVNDKGFHVFCQIYENRQVYYIDARGITTSFDEFMDVAKTFINDEYIIRPVESSDIEKWTEGDPYIDKGYAFAEAIIENYKECYTMQ